MNAGIRTISGIRFLIDEITTFEQINTCLLYTSQHWGMGIGNPLLPGPIYNKNGQITFISNRVLAHHIGSVSYTHLMVEKLEGLC